MGKVLFFSLFPDREEVRRLMYEAIKWALAGRGNMAEAYMEQVGYAWPDPKLPIMIDLRRFSRNSIDTIKYELRSLRVRLRPNEEAAVDVIWVETYRDFRRLQYRYGIALRECSGSTVKEG